MKLNQFLPENTNMQAPPNPEYYKRVIEYLRQSMGIPEGVELTVAFKPNVQFDSGQDGLTLGHPKDPNHIYVMLKPGMPASQLTRALAHEMVHVKQLVDGRLKVALGGQGLSVEWEGEPSKRTKYSRSNPWEIEAHTQERELLHDIIDKFGNPQ